MSRADRIADRATLVAFARRMAHSGIAAVEREAREVLEWIGEDADEE